MDWKKSIIVVTLVGVTVFAAVGCGQTAQTTTTNGQAAPFNVPTISVPEPAGSTTGVPATATAQPAPTAGQTAPASGSTKPVPPTGVQPTGKPTAPAIDYTAAAVKLGVTEEQLKSALGDLTRGPMYLAAAAKQLGVTEKALQEALGLPAGATPPAGAPPTGSPPPGGPAPTGQTK